MYADDHGFEIEIPRRSDPRDRDVNRRRSPTAVV